jgi:regulator of cell morphogenesis and NO signaling
MNTLATVGDLAAGSLDAVRVFEKYGIDYCCGGKRALADVCRERGLDPDRVLGELAQSRGNGGSRDWAAAALRELIAHIVSTHHGYLKLNLPHLSARMAKVLSVHGPHDASLEPLSQVLAGLRAELELHMHKEEMILFPFIERYESAAERGQPLPTPPFGTVANPIRMMEHEHDSAGDALASMRQITAGYALPAHACSTYRALFQGLEDLESDLHLHIHLENNILFPRAAELEASGQQGQRA